MKKVAVFVFLDHRDSYIHGDLHVPEDRPFGIIRFFFDESTTYEEMVRVLIQEGRLFPLDDPRLRYNLVLQAFEAYYIDIVSHSSQSAPPHAPFQNLSL